MKQQVWTFASHGVKDLNNRLWTREESSKKKMSHLELTHRPQSAECVRGTYIIIELVLSVSFNSPRLNAVIGYTKVIRRESSSFQKQAKFINRSLHNSSLYFHLGTPNQTFLAGENFDNPTERPRVARWIFRADLQQSDPFLSALEQEQIFSKSSFPKSVGKILHLSPPGSRQRILLLE